MKSSIVLPSHPLKEDQSHQFWCLSQAMIADAQYLFLYRYISSNFKHKVSLQNRLTHLISHVWYLTIQQWKAWEILYGIWFVRYRKGIFIFICCLILFTKYLDFSAVLSRFCIRSFYAVSWEFTIVLLKRKSRHCTAIWCSTNSIRIGWPTSTASIIEHLVQI